MLATNELNNFNPLFASPIFVSLNNTDFDDQKGLSQPIFFKSLDMLATNELNKCIIQAYKINKKQDVNNLKK